MVFWIWIVKLFWIVLFHLRNIIIVSFDTKLDFWILLIFFGIVCSTWCIFSMWSINCVTSLVRKVGVIWICRLCFIELLLFWQLVFQI
jgi:hypothetical protein